MIIVGKGVLVTGANRGIGRALVGEALYRGAAGVYAGTREPLVYPEARVTPLTLDITSEEHLRRAVDVVESLDILINNAGVAVYVELSDRSLLEEHLAVNLFGTYGVIQAFLPLLVRSGRAIVNNLSLNALAPVPAVPAYSVSKAAAFSLSQALRVLLRPQGVRLLAVLTGPVDTDMTRGIDIPKTSVDAVARAIFDGVANEKDEIFPDPMSASLPASWHQGAAKTLERECAALATDVLVGS